MNAQDIVALTPQRGLLALIALVLAGMVGCFWTAEVNPESMID